ncbi:MAG: DUF1538 domain-containing protein [Balneolaceae bacterium]|nr:DUF1538 domain-containing protein [Balneolaceae bacterium]MCH8548526.1 DUF1538 domain-containing protein [Balneolaceae bacterium]
MQTVQDTIMEVVYAILPITILVLILQYTLIWLPFESVLQFLVGVVLVSTGFALFLMGVHIGLLPIGEMIGAALPKTGKVWMILLFSFILGFAVTVAEPDVHVLAGYVDQVSDGEIGKWTLIIPVALGLGVFVSLSMARIVFNVSIKWLLFGGYSIVFALALSPWVSEQFVPISFDAGGVTTGPMAVPFILAFGVGIASVLRADDKSADGFGLVALASIGPLIAVLLLGIFYGL